MAFTWVKRNKKSNSWFWWMWNWTRSNPEVCLLAVKWKPKRFSAKVHSVIDTPIEWHSKKPDVTRLRIKELCGGGDYLELFARQKSEGWDVWWNEVCSDIKMEECEVLDL
jgi:N6-adenosine-specific RNA methylase IME4